MHWIKKMKTWNELSHSDHKPTWDCMGAYPDENIEEAHETMSEYKLGEI